MLAAKLHDVPHDQEVAGQLELRDYAELMFELAARAIVRPLPAFARAGLGQRPKIAVGRFTGRQRIIGEAVTEILEREFTAIGYDASRDERMRQIAEHRGHRGGSLQVTLLVDPKRASGLFERRSKPD